MYIHMHILNPEIPSFFHIAAEQRPIYSRQSVIVSSEVCIRTNTCKYLLGHT